jgi:trimethyllysine dioxygenase
MADLTKNIWVHGFCLVENAEPTPEATKAFLEKIGPIRNTHYGGFYDFVPDLALADTAYTNIALPAHTDTTYFTEPAGLQAFHCLEHEAPPDHNPDEPLGGESLLVDGFQAARTLKRESPGLFDVLREAKIPWHASGNKGIAITPNHTYPVIEVDRESNKIYRIRWNNDDRGVVHLFDSKRWYEAARKWNEIIRRESSQYWFKLTPGTIVIFDNWRVMHGRSAFKGNRRMCGAYIPRDDFVSRYRETNFEHDRVVAQNLNQCASHGSSVLRRMPPSLRRKAIP